MATIKLKRKNKSGVSEEFVLNASTPVVNKKDNAPLELWVGTAEEYSQATSAPEEGVVYILTQN